VSVSGGGKEWMWVQWLSGFVGQEINRSTDQQINRALVSAPHLLTSDLAA